MSLFISRVPACVNEQLIKEEFAYTYGKVRRVDFAVVGKTIGFGKENFSNEMSAYVYFDLIYPEMQDVIDKINEGNVFMYQCMHIRLHMLPHWTLLKNMRPVPDTLMNIPQIVEGARRIETTVSGMMNDCEDFKEELEDVSKTLDVLLEQSDMQQNVILKICKVVHDMNEENKRFREEIRMEERIRVTKQIDVLVRENESMKKRLEALEKSMPLPSSHVKDLSSSLRVKASFDLCGNQ